MDGGGAELGNGRAGRLLQPHISHGHGAQCGLREASGLLHDGVAPGTSLEDLITAYNKQPVRNVHFCRTELNLTQSEQSDVVEFVRNGLTDPRAAQEQTPFDRPKLANEN